MKARCVLELTSLQSGVSSKSGKPYHKGKFLDSEAEEFVSLFMDETLFRSLESMEKHTPVCVTLSISLNSKFFKLEAVEPIETN